MQEPGALAIFVAVVSVTTVTIHPATSAIAPNYNIVIALYVGAVPPTRLDALCAADKADRAIPLRQTLRLPQATRLFQQP